jgi:hypothetical protein
MIGAALTAELAVQIEVNKTAADSKNRLVIGNLSDLQL